MSERCRSEELDAFLRGELGPARAAALGRHLASCAGCGHELAWLRSERELFEQRSARPDPRGAAVWVRLERRLRAPGREGLLERAARWFRGLRAESSLRARWAVALAAAVVVLVGVGHRGDPGGEAPHEAAPVEASAEEYGLSLDPRFVIASLEQRYGACLLATPNASAPCPQAVPASFP